MSKFYIFLISENFLCFPMYCRKTQKMINQGSPASNLWVIGGFPQACLWLNGDARPVVKNLDKGILP